MNARDSTGEHRRGHLERLAHRALRELPPCRAPAGLEARVLAEIERRAKQPERPTGIAHWPASARALLIAGCVLCAALVWLVMPRLYGAMMYALSAAGVADVIDGLSGTIRMFVGLAGLAARLVRMIPKDWLFGGLFVISVAYAALIALGYLLLSPRSKVHSV